MSEDRHQAAAGDAVRGWLVELQACVRAVDYERARPNFLPDVVGFGTYSGVLDGLDALMQRQWRQVWPAIRDFTFRLDELRAGGDGALAWGASPWDSLGRRDDGTTFPRPGRMTVILVRRGDRWLAAHTHFSLYPATDARDTR